MSEVNHEDASARRKRVQTLKKLIIITLIISILIPWTICIFLLHRISGLKNELEDVKQAWLAESGQDENNPGDGRDSDGDGAISSVSDGDGELSIGESGLTDTIPDGAAHKVYLTFDDGPSIYTSEILAILQEYDVRATFFVVGKEGDSAREALQAIVEQGHTLGMHSYSHEYGTLYQSLDSFADDFTKLQDYLYDVTGVKSTAYRFPGGSSNTVSDVDMNVFADYLDEQGVTFYDWNLSSGDGGRKQLTVEQLVKNSTENIPDWETSIILMHDSAEKRTTVDALPDIIETILAMEDTEILPITENTNPVQHLHRTER